MDSNVEDVDRSSINDEAALSAADLRSLGIDPRDKSTIAALLRINVLNRNRPDKDPDRTWDAFVIAMEAAANNPKEVEAYVIPRADATGKILAGAGIVVTAKAAKDLFGSWLVGGTPEAENDADYNLENDKAA